jgi:multidrug efflux system membrane fusion protein
MNSQPSVGPARVAKPIVVATVGLIVVFGALYAWRSTHAAPVGHFEMPPLPVSTLKVQSSGVTNALEAIGSLQAVREVLLAPDTAGRVTSIHFEAGQTVKQGSVLVQLYDAPEQADRAAAAAKADFAQLQLRRSQGLAPTGAEPRELLEQRQAEADQAAAAVKQLDARIQQKTIRAPFSGQIGIRRINPGQYLNAGDAIATLTQLDPLYVNFTVPQQDRSKLKAGASVQVSVDAAPGRVFRAKISSVEPRINGETRNVVVQAQLPNPDRTLQSGMYATARLELPATAEAIALPLTAIQTSASGDSVVLVQAINAEGIGKAVTVPVMTGRRLGEEVLVTKGVKSGDVVVTAGQVRLPPGAAVKITPAAAPAALVAAVVSAR